MKLQTKLFQEVSANLHKIAAKNGIVPIISNILIKGDGENIRFTTTNLKHTIIATKQFNQKIDMCVDAEKFNNIMRLIKEDEFELSVKGLVCTIKSGKDKWQLSMFDSTEFPIVHSVNDVAYTELTRDEILRIKDLLPFASTDETMYHMKSVSFKTIGGITYICSWDKPSAGMLMKELGLGDGDCLIPSDAIKGLIEHDMSFGYNKTNAVFETEIAGVQYSYICQLIDNEYPAMKSLFIDKPKNVFSFLRKDMLEALRKVEVSAGKYDNFRIEFNDELIVSSVTDEGIESSTSISYTKTSGVEPFAFNAELMRKCINFCLYDTVVVESNSNSSVHFVYCLENPQEKSLFMPITFNK